LQLCLDYAETNIIDDIESFPKQRKFIKLATENKLYALNFLSPEKSVSFSLEGLFKPEFVQKHLANLLLNISYISRDLLNNKFFKITNIEAQQHITSDKSHISFDTRFLLTFDIQTIKKNIGQFMSTMFKIEGLTRVSSYDSLKKCINDFLNGSVPKCQGCVGSLNVIITSIYLTYIKDIRQYVRFKSEPTLNTQILVIAYDKERVWYVRCSNNVYWRLGCQSVHAFVDQFLSE